MKKNKKKQLQKITIKQEIGWALITFGIILICIVIFINAKDIWESEKAIKTFQQTKLLTEPIPATSDNAVDDADRQLALDMEMSTVDKVELSELIGLLRIPKIHLEEAVREGSTNSVLSSALGHMEHTAMPGEEGNCCIAGHRNYTFGKYFNRLNELEVGDTIEIETYDNIYQYKVYDIFVIEPTQVDVLNSLDGEKLTLITCTPLFVGSHRLIIRAERIDL